MIKNKLTTATVILSIIITIIILYIFWQKETRNKDIRVVIFPESRILEKTSMPTKKTIINTPDIPIIEIPKIISTSTEINITNYYETIKSSSEKILPKIIVKDITPVTNLSVNVTSTTTNRTGDFFEDEITKELRAYGNQIGKVIKIHSPNYIEEYEAFNNLIKNPQNIGAAAILREISTQYSVLSDNIALINIPKEVSEEKIKLSDIYKSISIAIDTITRNTSETNLFNESLVSYNEKVISFIESIQILLDLFENNDIVFSPEEDGSIFTQ